LKKQHLIVGALLALTIGLAGCSWSDITNQFMGKNATDAALSSSGPVAIEDYDLDSCIKLAEYKGIEVDCTVSDEEIQNSIDQMVQMATTHKKVKKGKAKKGQTVNINYTGKINGKEFDNGSAEEVDIQLGNSGYIDGFDDGVIGMKVGKKKDLKLKFPSDYQDKTVAGKDVVFTVKLNYIEGDEIVPKVTDEFIKKQTNSQYKTIKEYKEATRKNQSASKEQAAGETALTQVVSNTAVIELPKTVVEAQKRQIDTIYRHQITSQMGESTDFETALGSMGMTKEQYDTQIQQTAEGSTKTLLVVEAICKKEGISDTDADIETYRQNIVSSAGIQEDDYEARYKEYYGDAITFADFVKISYHYDKGLEVIKKNVKIKK